MFFILLFICNLIVLISAQKSPYVPADNIVHSCSIPSSLTLNHRYLKSKFLLSNASRVSEINADDPNIPKACIYHNQFNETFSVSPGPKFIRLYFNPVSYSGLNISKALFTATVGQFTLFRTSKSSYSGENFDAKYTMKEYIVNIDGQAPKITFTPSSDYSDTYGFVNQIDVVSMPPSLYIRDVGIPVVGYPSQFYMGNFTALETIYRLNVGGGLISQDDTGMSRPWSTDDGYLNLNETDAKTVKSKVAINYSSQVQAYTAPAEIYATARIATPNSNMTWSLPLDSSFCYLIRLHFCEIAEDYKEGIDRVFPVYIGNKTNELQADTIHLNQGKGVPIFRDYVVNFSRSSQSIELLHIAIIGNSSAGLGYDEAILNGLEIFRLSDHSNNLAGPNPFAAKKALESSLEEPLKTFKIAFDILLGIMVIFSVFGILINYSLPRSSYSIWGKETTQWQPSDHCPCFSLNELKLATGNFSQAFLIGAGGFGKVYKGSINNDTHTVAIKRASPNSHQGLDEFKTEITLLSKLRHRHLVSLVGYCSENQEMILVYDFMSRGTLRDHLYKSKKPPLSWKLRLSICIGAARGLHYLHTGSKNMIIHRDVKTSNILLDENWVAKVSDLGLSKVGPNLTTHSDTHVTTLVKGSFGYLDPEYYRRKKLTEKSDVYSFGVVLFEVLCARPAVLEVREIEEEEHEKVNLAQWVVHCYERLDQIIDPNLQGKIDPECFKTFTNIAGKCLADQGNERPSMGDVLWNLEVAWKQQENAELKENRGSVKPSWRFRVDGQVTPAIDEEHCIFVNNSDQNIREEFSDIMEPVGR